MRLYTFGRAVAPFAATVIARVAAEPIPAEHRGDYAALLDEQADERFTDGLEGYAAVLSGRRCNELPPMPAGTPTIVETPNLDRLRTGDVVGIDPAGAVRFLYRKSSTYNSILVTQRCNSRCLMCPQPPRERDSDGLADHLRLIDLIDPSATELGITGGEPTLLGDGFFQIVERCKQRLPWTALHVLTNGRLFYYSAFARRLGALRHPDLVCGIPLYSDLDHEHDTIVQAQGAFGQTVIGLLNLARYRVPVEVRVVLHALTYRRLPEFAEFIYRNLPFAAHVAFMGLEMVGHVHRNLDLLWVDPVVYQPELERATTYLADRGMNVSIYNLPLCLLPESLWPFARKSISDWKNIYLPECATCFAQDQCGGLFESARKRHSEHIRPLSRTAGAPAAEGGA